MLQGNIIALKNNIKNPKHKESNKTLDCVQMDKAQSNKWKCLFVIKMATVLHIVGLSFPGDGEHFTVGCRNSDSLGVRFWENC